MILRVEPFEEYREERFASLASNATNILVVSPFISVGAAPLLLRDGKQRTIRVITRYNLEDFAVGVSQLPALEALVNAGAHIRGRRGLHSKLYLFDSESMIVSSANLTGGGLKHNLEFGLEIEGHEIVTAARSYFERLWSAAENDLTLPLISRWKDEVDDERARRGHQKYPKHQLPDHGTEVSVVNPLVDFPSDKKSKTKSTIRSSEAPRVFVKFFGTSKDRSDSRLTVREVIRSSECYYACTYPRNKRPRRIRHGDVIYMAAIMDPVGYAIFGRAVAIPYVPGRDDATPNEVERQAWKTHWPRYIRVFAPVFIDAPLSDCVSLALLINKLGAQAFASTAKNMAGGGGNTDPNRALMQKPDVEITGEAAQLLAEEFEKRMNEKGGVPLSFLDSLPKSDIQLGSPDM
jgi:hypothetical protein